MSTSSDGAAPVVCSACGSQNREGARFCVDCGSPFAERCAACGTELVAGARFCDACGAATAASAETPGGGELRKTVTILFADLVGSTSLQETLDTESVRRVMTRFYDTARAAIEAHEGQVVKFTGDGVMAAFGVPLVREDDALRGVRAAHALVEGLATLNQELDRDWGVQLRLRTGVNTGEVVVGGEDGDLIGDPVNVAARLEQAAGDGEVLVGEQTERLVRRDVQLEPVAPLDLKGKAEPVPAFRLVALDAQAGQGAAAVTALVGREDELARLRAAFDGAVATRSCALVTVIGSPGIGKTRLADELARSVAGEATVLEGRCEATDGGISFAPIAEVLRAAADIGEGDSTEQAREKLAGLLPVDGDRDVVVERALGVLGAVPAASTEETFWGVRRVLEALAREQPLVLVLDDVHWGQPTYLDLVEHLVEWARDAPLLLVALARPELRELREALASGRRAVDVVELDPLGAADSRTLVDELLGQVDLPELLAERVLRATEGNPLFVAETVRMLVDEGVLTRDGETWVVASDSLDVEMPPTIHALIAARLERLGGDERAVVERASVIGKQFYRGAVADLCSYPVGRGIDGHLETLRRKELVQPEGTYWIDEPVFRFHHVLIRDAAYRSVLKEARAELHERFAEWLQSKAGELIGEQEEVVAFHLEQAHEYRGQLGPLDERGRELGRRAADRLASAGRRALAREDLPAAANLLGRALDRLDDDADERPAVLIDLAETLLSAGDTHGAAAVVEQLPRVAADDERLNALASVYAAQLAYLTDSSHLNEAVETLAADAEKLAALGDEAGVAKANHVQAGALAQLGQVGATEAALDRALAAARNAGDTRRVSAVLAGAPLAALWGPSAVVRASGRCLDVVRILRMTPGNRHLEAAALSCQAVLEAMRGRADAARSMLDGCRATFEELGLGLELLENEVHSGIVDLLDDDAAGAEAHLRAAYEGFSALGTGAGTERASALLARTLLDQGRDAEADELTRISEERGGEDLKATIAWCGVRAEVLARRGEHAAAEELARRGATMAAQTDALTDHADAQMALAAVLRAAGDDEAAAGAARRALELYEEKDNHSGIRRASAFTGAAPAPTPTAAEAGGSPQRTPGADVEPDARTPGETVNERLVRRYADAINARDWQAAEACMTDDFMAIDHRVLATVGRERDRATYDAQTRALHDQASDLLSAMEVIADFDDIGVGRGGWSGHLNDGGGAFELALAIVSRRRGDQFERFEIFDPDDEPGWCARLGELLGERGRALSVGAQSLEFLRARDWDAMRASYLPDATQRDRRRVGGGEIRGGEQITAFYSGLIELAPDAQPHLVSVLDCAPDSFLVRLDIRGHAATGGEIEVPYILLEQVRDGLCGNLELFDIEDEDAARRRFAELSRPATQPTLGAVIDRYVAACNRQDWEALGDIFAPDLRFVDRRLVGWGEGHGREAYVEVMRGRAALTDDLRVSSELLAVGRAATVMRVLTSGRLTGGGGDFEIETVVLTTFSDGLATYFEIFEDTDAIAALERFEEIGARTVPEREVAHACRLINARDWNARGVLYHDDFTVTDHRALGWEPVRGPEAMMEIWRSWVELVPDVEMTFELLEGDERRIMYFFTGRGHAADGGGEMEYGVILVSLYRDGRLASSDTFEADDHGAAHTLYQELGRDRPRTPREVVEHYIVLSNAQDWDGLRDIYVPDLRFVDHRLVGWGELEGRDAFVEIVRGTVALTHGVRVTDEILAIGRASSLTRYVYRGRMVDGGGDFEIDSLALALYEDGRVTQFEIFEGADTQTAYERFEEIGAETEPERLFVRVCRLATARDWEALFELWAPDYEGIDHRAVGWDVLHGPAAAVELSRSTVEVVPDAEFRFELLAGDDDGVVAHLRVVGQAAPSAGGGPVQYDVAVTSTSSDGQVARNDWFDSDAEALTYFQQQRSGRPTTPRELIDRYVAATNVQDWDALRDLFAPDMRFVDHRLVGWGELEGRDAYLDIGRGMAALTLEMDASAELLAVGQSAVVTRFVYRGRLVEGGGDYEIVGVALSLFENGQCSHFEIFEETDVGMALERFEEIGAQGEAERRLARVVRLANARDWDAFADRWAPDYRGVDHRSPAVWGELRGPAAAIDLWRSWTEIAPDAEFRFEALAGDDERIAVRIDGAGHAVESAGGGPLEYGISLVVTFSDGLTFRNDWFDSDADALAYFEEQRASDPPGTLREFTDRYAAAVTALDWDALSRLYVEDLRFVDHRLVGWGELEGREAYLEILRGAIALASDPWVTWEPIALTLTTSLVRFVHGGRLLEGGGEFEVETIALSLHDAGRVTYFEVFEGTEVDAALARFDEIGAATEPERVMARLCRLGMARDWEGLGDLYREDFTATDQRALGWEPLRGSGAMADFYRSWAETVPDFVLSFELLAGDEQWNVVRHGGRGHAADGGGEMEYLPIQVNRFRDGRLADAEIFDADDEAGALARYEELRRRDRPRTPRELVERYVDLHNVADWDALGEIYTPDVRFVDHRLVGWGECEGREAFTEIGRQMSAMTHDHQVEYELLASGAAAYVARFVYRGHMVDGGGEFEIAALALALYEDGSVTHFEIYEVAEAQAVLERFEATGAATTPERLMARLCRLAGARDWDGVRDLYADGFTGVDHRQLGWEALEDGEGVKVFYRSWAEVVPDLELSFELIVGDEQQCVVRHGGRGHAADGGGDMEYATIMVNRIIGGLFAAIEVFDTDDEAAAIARYEELRRSS